MSNVYSAPEADVIQETYADSDINNFKRFSAWGVFLLSLVTLGLYQIYWIYSRTKILNQSVANRIGQPFIQIVTFLYVLSFISSYVPLGESVQIPLMIFNLVAGILSIVWNFKFMLRVEKLMGKGTELSGILTFFAHVIYLQYKINEAIDKGSN
ncbi:MAG: DUF4234 domain-containing protein [Lentisphaeraceae bacterium]|nr:DUF4234 domain-containing protein [Lentisphaeraceae bacterium]